MLLRVSPRKAYLMSDIDVAVLAHGHHVGQHLVRWYSSVSPLFGTSILARLDAMLAGTAILVAYIRPSTRAVTVNDSCGRSASPPDRGRSRSRPGQQATSAAGAREVFSKIR
jgi:hypothetical protein